MSLESIPTASLPWQPKIVAVAQRFDQEYQGEAFDLPPEIEEMTVFRDWVAGTLAPRIASPFGN